MRTIMIMGAFAIASTLGMPFALYLANKLSWHAPFLLVGSLGVVFVPFLVLYLPKMDSHIQANTSNGASHKLEVIRNVIKNPL